MKKQIITSILVLLPNIVLAFNETEKTISNSVGIKLVRIEPGSFLMGQEKGEHDEQSLHKVEITKPFYMAETEVTNAQFERFRPGFRKTSSKPDELSNGDSDAVIFVSWFDAVDFCKWLSKKDGRPYRLPTEAEWEYACRAGTTTLYNTGDELPENYHKNQNIVIGPKQVPLEVGKTPANNWGLYDMHGNVEEWCMDWYGPYVKGRQADPAGYAEGEFRVTRGGSHSTPVEYLRSANRMGAIPEDKHWLLGFRVVIGEMPKTKPLTNRETKLFARNVSRKRYNWPVKVDMSKPYFKGPIEYVREPAADESVPFYSHNHCPAITWCDNGDLLAVWFSVEWERYKEKGREMTILASRLRAGKKQWDLPSEFYKVPDRNMTGSALINDRKGRLYFVNGVSAADHWMQNNALIMRTSEDNGATWSKTRLINPVRGVSSQPIGAGFCMEDGTLVVPSDWPWSMNGGGTALWFSRDRGVNWRMADGPIKGIHAGVVQLDDGRFVALGRMKLNAPMPLSVSSDHGKSWEYSDTPMPGIGGGQRLVLRKLKEGPLVLISFTKRGNQPGMKVLDKAGNEQVIYGMYSALSCDGGRTWKNFKPVTPGGPIREFDPRIHAGKFITDETHAEPYGYLAGLQTPDGMFQLISSSQYYKFNLAWLKEPMPVPAAN